MEHIILIPVILFSLLFSLNLLRKSLKNSRRKLPPGPRKLPVIGNLHNLIGGLLPHHTFRDLSRKYGPLMHLKMGQVPTLIVSSPEMAREFMKTHDISFVQRPQFMAVEISSLCRLDIAFAPYGDYWKQMRKLCVTELLSTHRIKSFSSIREEEARTLVEFIRSESSLIDLSERFLDFMNSMLCRSAFGNKVDERHTKTLISAMMEGSRLTAGFDLSEMYPSSKFLKFISPVRAKLTKLDVKISRTLQAIIDAHISEEIGESEHAEAVEDFVDVLLRVQKSGSLAVPITVDHIKAVVSDVFSGGTETTATAMEWTMAELVKNPRVMKKAQAEIRELLKGKTTFQESDIRELSYLKSVIKESLRLHPPAPLLLPRECREACTIDGYEIPIKTRVIVNAWAIGRDPKYWEDPESFVPERFVDGSVDYKGANFEFTPFGAGRRMCPGMSFTLASVEIVLAQLLYHFDWHLPDGMETSDLDMTEVFGSSVIMKHHLRLRAVPFKPADE